MPNQTMLHDYRAERDSQAARYEAVTGLPIGETHRQEYRDYFGVGDCHGYGVERLISLRDFMVMYGERPEPVDELEPEPVDELEPVAADSDPLSRAYVAALESGKIRAAYIFGEALDGRLNVIGCTGDELAALALLEFEPAAREITRRAVKRAQRRLERVAA